MSAVLSLPSSSGPRSLASSALSSFVDWVTLSGFFNCSWQMILQQYACTALPTAAFYQHPVETWPDYCSHLEGAGRIVQWLYAADMMHEAEIASLRYKIDVTLAGNRMLL